MKLRFRDNSVRLRINQREVAALAAGQPLEERIHFPAGNSFAYTLEPSVSSAPEVSFVNGTLRISADQATLHSWAENDAIGLYFDIPGKDASLKIIIEKDLECVNEPLEERDPFAYPRSNGGQC